MRQDGILAVCLLLVATYSACVKLTSEISSRLKVEMCMIKYVIVDAWKNVNYSNKLFQEHP